VESRPPSHPRLHIRAKDGDELRSLLVWLCHEDALRAWVRLVPAPVPLGQMGGVIDVLVVSLGSGGAGAVLASSLSTWLSHPRRQDVKLTVFGDGGRSIQLEGRRVRDPVALLREVEQLLRMEDPEQ
jgi:hypothetical protein